MTKICTSIKQSKKLLSLGLDPSTADVYWSIVLDTPIPYIATKLEYQMYKEGARLIPAWSLTALLKLIPLYTLEQTTDGKVIAVSEIGQYSKCSEAWDNPVDAAFEIVCWLIEKGHIKVNK